MDRRSFGLGILAAGAWPTVALGTSELRIGLNHLYAILDASTAHAIDNASLLHRVASVFTHATTAADGQHWTGRYIFLRTQYLEFFGVGDDASQGGSGEGTLGFALGGDRIGDLQRVQNQLTKDGEQSTIVPARRHVGGKDVLWFQTLEVSRSRPEHRYGNPMLEASAMEYAPAALVSAQPPVTSQRTADESVSRMRYNAKKYRGELLSELAGVTVAVSRTAFESRLRPLLVAAGWGLSEHGNATNARGPEHNILFLFAPDNAVGLRELRFRLREPANSVQQETIGRSLFTLGPGRDATWTFHIRGGR